MKKAALIIILVIAGAYLIGNSDTIASFASTVAQGAIIPLVIAIIVMLLRYLTQAISYKASFEAVGFKRTTLWSNTVLIYSLVFINTFCMFGGATGVAFIVDDAHRKGADLGTATSGAFLSQIGFFAAVLVISVIGFVAMFVSGTVNWLVVIGSVAMMVILGGLSSLFFIGYFKPGALRAFFAALQKVLNKIMSLFKRGLADDWGAETAASFVENAQILANNPRGTAIAIGWASVSALFNMGCLIAVGFAYGFTNVPILIAAFALASVSVLLSPTPQGVGVVEAAIAALVTTGGGSLATATAIALVYRGILFWIPFAIGALMLSQSDFFKGKKKGEADEKLQRAKDTGWVAATMVGILGLVNLALAFVPSMLAPFATIVDWVNFSNVFVGPTLAIAGFLLLLLSCGLVFRFRMAWVATVCLLTLIACCEFLFYATVTVAVVTLVLVGWLYLRRGFFDKPLAFPKFVPPWKIHTPQDGVPSNSELSGAAGALNPADNQGATAAMLIEGSEAIRKSSSGSSLPQERE
ncbi:MAG: YbhN family protein [Eggerthellaceae bacterium]